MRGEGVGRALMVTQSNMTPFARQCLSEMAPKYMIEVFQEQELLVNITKHILVPEHQVLVLLFTSQRRLPPAVKATGSRLAECACRC